MFGIIRRCRAMMFGILSLCFCLNDIGQGDEITDFSGYDVVMTLDVTGDGGQDFNVEMVSSNQATIGSGEEFVEERSQGEDIGPGVHVQTSPPGLFRTHVLRGADELSLESPGGGTGKLGVDRLGDSEVDDFWQRAAVDRGDEDV